jgi:antirestriction protein
MKNIISKYINVEKPHKVLTESDSSSDIKVYMNTWKNYNEYGADLEMYGIKDGWMSVDDALEFCKKYSEDEPFINDVDNCPIEISEYDNAVSKLQELKKIEELPSDEQEMVGYFFEQGSYDDLDEIIEKIQSGDYVFLPQVNDTEDLGKAYFDMVGIEGISNPFQYVDRAQIMRSFRDNDSEDLSDSDYYAMADEEIENAEADGNLQYAEDNFDYEALGRDLEMDGYTYVSGGALQVL